MALIIESRAGARGPERMGSARNALSRTRFANLRNSTGADRDQRRNCHPTKRSMASTSSPTPLTISTGFMVEAIVVTGA